MAGVRVGGEGGFGGVAYFLAEAQHWHAAEAELATYVCPLPPTRLPELGAGAEAEPQGAERRAAEPETAARRETQADEGGETDEELRRAGEQLVAAAGAAFRIVPEPDDDFARRNVFSGAAAASAATATATTPRQRRLEAHSVLIALTRAKDAAMEEATGIAHRKALLTERKAQRVRSFEARIDVGVKAAHAALDAHSMEARRVVADIDAHIKKIGVYLRGGVHEPDERTYQRDKLALDSAVRRAEAFGERRGAFRAVSLDVDRHAAEAAEGGACIPDGEAPTRAARRTTGTQCDACDTVEADVQTDAVREPRSTATAPATTLSSPVRGSGGEDWARTSAWLGELSARGGGTADLDASASATASEAPSEVGGEGAANAGATSSPAHAEVAPNHRETNQPPPPPPPPSGGDHSHHRDALKASYRDMLSALRASHAAEITALKGKHDKELCATNAELIRVRDELWQLRDEATNAADYEVYKYRKEHEAELVMLREAVRSNWESIREDTVRAAETSARHAVLLNSVRMNSHEPAAEAAPREDAPAEEANIRAPQQQHEVTAFAAAAAAAAWAASAQRQERRSPEHEEGEERAEESDGPSSPPPPQPPIFTPCSMASSAAASTGVATDDTLARSVKKASKAFGAWSERSEATSDDANANATEDHATEERRGGQSAGSHAPLPPEGDLEYLRWKQSMASMELAYREEMAALRKGADADRAAAVAERDETVRALAADVAALEQRNRQLIEFQRFGGAAVDIAHVDAVDLDEQRQAVDSRNSPLMFASASSGDEDAAIVLTPPPAPVRRVQFADTAPAAPAEPAERSVPMRIALATREPPQQIALRAPYDAPEMDAKRQALESLALFRNTFETETKQARRLAAQVSSGWSSGVSSSGDDS